MAKEDEIIKEPAGPAAPARNAGLAAPLREAGLAMPAREAGHAPSAPGDAEHIFVVNPRSFQRRSDMDFMLNAIDGAFKKLGNPGYRIHISRYPRDAIGAVNNYCQNLPPQKPARIYAVGGDGILFDCLNAVMGHKNTELAIVPYGRENDFMRAFGEGLDSLFRDVAAQAVSPSIPTDVMYCDGNYSLNFVSIGMESVSVMWKTELIKRFKRMRNVISALNHGIYYVSAALGAFNEGFKNQYYKILADGEKLDGLYTTIHVANGPCYGKTMTPTGESVPDDGLLELVVGFARSAVDIFGIMTDLCYGRHTGNKYSKKESFKHRLVRELDISSDEPLIVNLDGEIFFESKMKIRIIPGGVRVVAPNGIRYLQRKLHRAYSISSGADVM